MKDFRIITAKVILNVYSVAPVRGFLPPSILVAGEKLDRASEVLYNGISVSEFAVVASNRLVVKIPKSQVGQKFQDIKVLAQVSAAKADATLSLGVTTPPKTVSGIDRLVQSWVIIFMTTPGSDIFTPNSGGGAVAIIGRPTDRSGKGVAADLAIAIERTKQEILRLQAGIQTIPPSEKLLSSSLDSIQYDQASTVTSARVIIQNMIGNSAEVSLG